MGTEDNKKAITFAELMISLVVISIIAAVLYPTIAQFTPNSNKPLFKAAYSTLTTVLFEITNSISSGKLVTYNINEDGTIAVTPLNLCTEFCQVANVLPEGDVENPIWTCEHICEDNILTTTNGMRWRFNEFGNYPPPHVRLDGGGDYTNVYRIIVDVNAANNDLSPTIEIDGINFPADDPDDPNADDPNADDPNADDPNADDPNADDPNAGVFYFEPSNADTKGIYTILPTTTTPHGTFNITYLKRQDTFIFLIDDEGQIVAMSPAGSAHLEDSLQSPD